jgi:iron complex outermembrane receptor protein
MDNGGQRNATFPANIRIGTPERPVLVNPSFATGCMPPFSVPVPGTKQCGYNHLAVINLLPPVERTNVFAGATWQLSPDHQLFAQYLYSYDRYERLGHVVDASPIANLQSQSIYYPAGGPFYPTDFAAAQGISGPLELYYRPFPLGPQDDQIRNEAQHFVAGAEGLVGGWNYNAAFIYSQSTVKISSSGGYVSFRRLADAMASGLVNPFGPSGPEGEALLAGAAWSGEALHDKAITSSLEVKASKEIYRLPAGALAVAVGAEARREELDNNWSAEATSGDILNHPPTQSTTGSRTVQAAFAELNVPIATGLEAQFAVRYDHYSDFGGTTNPKVAVRWQPNAAWLMRASYGTGFRAPTLADLWNPQAPAPASQRTDPRRCGFVPADCARVFRTIRGGNPDLQPEESRQWNVGVVWEPIPGYSIGIDYWKINKTNAIGALTDEQIFTNFDLFEATHIVRSPAAPGSPLPGPIERVIEITENLGDLWTSGVDVDLNLRGPATSFGRLAFNFNGTYVDKWQRQLDGIHYVAAVGRSVVGAVPRWRHYATLYWNHGPWTATLAQGYSSGYTQLHPFRPNHERKVGSYDIWNLQGTYSGLKNTMLTLGIKNLFDRAPPFSNQGGQGVVMFDPRYADPRGRLFYAQVAVSFK